ncbi:hypothetical protein G7062_08880 [Erysipelothrix sp. HDW6C]|uniref:amidase family protein n=1 Tax=Erysipelothrix sp. HDW6C TaxID=2714930 RepID=UPI00140A5109|nr:amidase family protein [Erysipelothrix sp. HDW6C]QIK70406.1 hypothetical protein G7062_08880 [Erysipelothrix sp. HDW6C]
MTHKIANFAIKSFNTFNQPSVVEAYPNIIRECADRLEKGEEVYYVGVKNTNVIPFEYLKTLEKAGYLMHTRDAMSERGRAIDHCLHNPITGRLMTGSSSGTAINVFKGINDIGIGTDGGGSVLGPAIALNLFGFISPRICNEALSQYSKKSTDNITFQPSIGFISKTLAPIQNIVALSLPLVHSKSLTMRIAESKNVFHTAAFETVVSTFPKAERIELTYDASSRQALMNDLDAVNFDAEILVCFEGPVDLFEYGDSLMGHYSEAMKEYQMQGYKYYLTVVNMLGLSALIIPTQDLSVGILMICKSEEAHIQTMFEMAKRIQFERSALEERYFSVEKY